MSFGLTLDNPAYFDRLDRADRDHWWPRAMWQIASHWLDEALAERGDLEAVDIGCGAGGTLDRLIRRPEIRRVVGLEPRLEALSRASSRRAELVRGDVLRLPFGPGSFDVITCLDVLQHLPPDGDRLALFEIRRILKPGGVALIRSNGRGIWPDPASDPPPYLLGDLVKFVRDTGLIVDRATYVNGLPAVASEVLGKMRGRSEHPSGQGLRIEERRRGWRPCLATWVASAEAWAVGRCGMRLPVGHGTMILARHPGGGE